MFGYYDAHPRIAYHWKRVAEQEKSFENFEIFFLNTCDNGYYCNFLVFVYVLKMYDRLIKNLE